jgi:tetratricopeptide (TPR) repeat protein
MQIPGLSSNYHSQTLSEKASAWVLVAGILLSAGLVLPFFDNFMVSSKILILFVVALVLSGLFLFNAFVKNKIEIALSPIVGALTFFGAAIAAATFLTTKYPVNNLLGMGGVYLAVAVIGIVGGSILAKKSVQLGVMAVIVSGVITAALTLLQLTGFGVSWIINSLFSLQLPNTLLFHPSGSPFIAVQFLAVTLIATIAWVAATKKASVPLILAMVVMVAGLAANVWVVLPGKMAQPLLLPYTASWSVALDVLRTPASALIGIGPENYGAAYSIFKPAWINKTSLWNVQFTQGSNMPFTILSSAGLVGLVAWIILLIVTFKLIKAEKTEPEIFALGAGLVTIFIIQLLFAPNVVLLTLMAALLAFLIAGTRKKHARFHAFSLSIMDNPFMNGERATISNKATRYIGLVLGGALVLAISVGVVRGFWASNLFFRSALAMQKNDAVKVYNLQQRATELNPYSDAYRRQYALTNIQIAAALSNKADATAEEQQQVAQLIQQAIREARAATLIGADDTKNWQVLGQIYRNLIGLASDANQWATSTYTQAIQTATNDPSLRIELGGIFYAQGQYDQALALFQQAVALKPDLPNAYYNAANAYVQLKQYDQAKAAYQQTLALLPSNSDSYVKAAQELETIEKAIAEQKKAAPKESQTTGNQTSNQSNSQVPTITNQTVTQPESTLLQQQQQPVNVTPNAGLEASPAPTPVASPSP